MTRANLTPRDDLDLRKFRKLLEGERDHVQAQLDGLERQDHGQSESQEFSELSDYDQHPADVATETFFRERDEAIHDDLRRELAQVQSALDKVSGGTYGYCDRCQKRIDVSRLKALPYATMCLTCQNLAEGQG